MSETTHAGLLGKRVANIAESSPFPGGWARVIAVHLCGHVTLACSCCGSDIGLYPADNLVPLPDEQVSK